jgi:hypothetical protein
MGCNEHGTDVNESAEEVSMTGMDKVSMGGGLQVVIRTQAEYDRLVYDRYTKPLQDYWDKYYASILESVKSNYPNRSDSEYVVRVKQVFYSALPFKGTEGYVHPTFDFSKYTLLGQSVTGHGCSVPTYQPSVLRNDKDRSILFRVVVQQEGTCDMGWDKHVWMLVRKVSTNYVVNFETKTEVLHN